MHIYDYIHPDDRIELSKILGFKKIDRKNSDLKEDIEYDFSNDKNDSK